jgi:hypothetical protein
MASTARYVGAAALAAIGIDHIWQFSVDHYSAIPTIGTLFALNFASAVVLAVALVTPLPWLGRRRRDALRALAALGGIGVAAGSLAGLLVSETAGLFGFIEVGYRSAIVLAIGLDVATMVLLGAFLVTDGRRLVRPEGAGRRPPAPADVLPLPPRGSR